MQAHQADIFDTLLPVEVIQERAKEIRLTARDLARLARCNENTLGHAFAGKSRLQRATHGMVERALRGEERRLFEYLKRLVNGADDTASSLIVLLWAVLLPIGFLGF